MSTKKRLLTKGRKLRTLAALLVAGAAVSMFAASQAQASTPSDLECFADTNGGLIVPAQAEENTTPAHVQWTAQVPAGCSITRTIKGPGFIDTSSLSPSGSKDVPLTQPGNATWTLKLTSNRTGKSVDFDSRTTKVISQELTDASFVVHAASGPVQTVTAQGVLTSNDVPVAAGSSPALTFTSAGRVTAYAGTDGFLRIIAPNGSVTKTGLGVMANTSPSIVSTGLGGYLIAFQGSTTGHLWTVGNLSAAHDTTFTMAPATSPSIALDWYGYTWIAYQGSDRELREVHPDGHSYQVAGGKALMMPRTSPSLSRDLRDTAPYDFEIAYQGQNGTLWSVAQTGALTNLQLPMAPGSSPNAIANYGVGGSIVFVAGDHSLWYYSLVGGNRGRVSNGLGVAPNTSPVTTLNANGHLNIGFQAYGEGTLWTVGVESADYFGHDTGIAMAPGTSPGGAAKN